MSNSSIYLIFRSKVTWDIDKIYKIIIIVLSPSITLSQSFYSTPSFSVRGEAHIINFLFDTPGQRGENLHVSLKYHEQKELRINFWVGGLRIQSAF